MAVDARHASSVAMLAAASARAESITVGNPWSELRAIEYTHTSNLPQGRALWLRDQIANKSIDWAISVDGDTTFNAHDVMREMWHVVNEFAIGLAPVRCGGSADTVNLNLIGRDGMPTRISASEINAAIEGRNEIESGGFGLAIFNLGWFRRLWTEPAPEGISMACGEDIAMCRSVRSRGGKVRALRIRTEHFAFGEDQLDR